MSFACLFITRPRKRVCSSSSPFPTSADFKAGCANDSLTATYCPEKIGWSKSRYTYYPSMFLIFHNGCYFYLSIAPPTGPEMFMFTESR